ncbi:MAG: helix-turn-helix domain-containing protein, partial [Actinomycetota bacterium]
RKAVPFDGSMWFGVDPATLLAVAPARFENLDAGYCAPLWHGEFHDHDVVLFRDLARGPVAAGSLRAATDDRPLRSARYREFVRPQGYGDELRTVFRVGESTWGMAALYRDEGRKPFDDDDIAVFDALSTVVASAYRARAAVATPTLGLVSAPGLLLFDDNNVLVSANGEAARWLCEIYGVEHDGQGWLDLLADPSVDDLLLPFPTIPLLARARAVAAGREDQPARLRLRDRAGRWVVLHASRLDGSGGHGSVAVVVEPAKSAEIAPIIIEAYGLSPRERDVVRSIARGSSTPEIAAELFLSAHTVRDYIKSVFEKVGVSSRGELVAKLFAEHYSDPLHETAVHIH